MEKTIIAFKDFEYVISMKSFFKDEFKSGSHNYLISLDHIKWFKRNIFPKIRDACSYVCPHSVPCKGHKLLIISKCCGRHPFMKLKKKKCITDTFIFKI